MYVGFLKLFMIVRMQWFDAWHHPLSPLSTIVISALRLNFQSIVFKTLVNRFSNIRIASFSVNLMIIWDGSEGLE